MFAPGRPRYPYCAAALLPARAGSFLVRIVCRSDQFSGYAVTVMAGCPATLACSTPIPGAESLGTVVVAPARHGSSASLIGVALIVAQRSHA